MCDVSYVLLLERLERQVLSDRLLVGMARMWGGAEDELPTLDEAREAFDESLLSMPSEQDQRNVEFLRAMGA